VTVFQWALFCLLSGFSYIAWSAESSVVPVIRVDTTNLTSLAVGLEVGRQSKQYFPDIEQRYDTHLQALFSQGQFNYIVKQKLPYLLQQLSVDDRQELKGIRAAWSITERSQLGDGRLSADEYHVLALLPELGVPAGGIGLGVFDQVSAEGGPIVGRNLDWRNTPALRAVQAITVYQYPEQTVVNVGFAGMPGILTGFNDQGLFAAYFDAGSFSPYLQETKIDPSAQVSGFALRAILRTRVSVSQAIRDLSGTPLQLSNSILLADRKTVKVLEYQKGRRAAVRSWDSATREGYFWDRVWQIAVVGCHVLSVLTDPCQNMATQVRWQRLDKLLNFHPTQPAHAGRIADILLDTRHQKNALLNDQTIQSQLYLPASNRLYLYAKPETGKKLLKHQVYTDLIPGFIKKSGISVLMWVTLIAVLVAFAGILWFVRKTDVFTELMQRFSR
jgi:hypothetical protein